MKTISRSLSLIATAALAAAGLVVAPPQPATAAVPTEGLLAHYDFTETSGATVHDISGNNRDAAVLGTPNWVDGGLRLSGAAGSTNAVKLPNNILQGATEATISVDVRPDAATLSRANFLWNMGGTSASSGSGTGSWFLIPNGTLRTAITPSHWTGEQSATWTSNNLTANTWANVTTTLQSNGNGTSTLTLYVNGVQRGQNTGVTLTPASLAVHTNNLLGGSAYPSDAGFAGVYGEARIYNTAITAGEVADISAADAASTAQNVLARISLPSSTTQDLLLPGGGVTWASSASGVIATNGTVTRPAFGQPDAEVTLTGSVTVRGVTETRQFAITVPALADGEPTPPAAANRAADFPLNATVLDANRTGGFSFGGVTGAVWQSDHLDLTSGSGYLANGSFTGFTLPGSSSATFSFDALIPASATGTANTTLFTYGSNATTNNLSFRPFRTAGSAAAEITVSSSKVAVAETSRAVVRDMWVNYTVVLNNDADTLTVYENGVQVAQATGVTQNTTSIGNGVLRLNREGVGFTNLPSRYRDVKVYRVAATPAQVTALARVNAAFAWEKYQPTLDAIANQGIVTADLPLGANPLVSWASSAPSVISAGGAVTQPAPGEPDVEVTLTASYARGGMTLSREIELTVPARLSDLEKAQADADALGVLNADALRTIVTLPAAGAEYGSTVSWSTADPEVLALLEQAGTVYAEPSRPAYGSDPVVVDLTATVAQGAESVTRAIPVTVLPTPRVEPDRRYAFAYFTANTIQGENVYFAASNGNNALSWQTLNGGNFVLTSEYGERGLRDPFIIRDPSGDKFYMIATDLSIGRNGDWGRAQQWGSRYLEVWESSDLVNWSDQRHVLVAPETAGMTWAPEAYFDDELGEYVVFWASRLYTNANHTDCVPNIRGTGSGCYARMLYATTKDFITFSEAQVWQDTGYGRIDTTVLKDGDYYYRFTKDEGSGSSGCSDIITERSPNLTTVTTNTNFNTPGNWTLIETCLARNAGQNFAVEGPTIFKANPDDTSPYDYYLYLDNYGGSGYFPVGTNDLSQPGWTRVSGSLPASRHGTVLPVTLHQWQSLTGAALTRSGSTTLLDYDRHTRVLTAQVTVADGYQIGGKVAFSGGAWSETVQLPVATGSSTVSITVPGSVALGTPLQAEYLGTAEIGVSTGTASVLAIPGAFSVSASADGDVHLITPGAKFGIEYTVDGGAPQTVSVAPGELVTVLDLDSDSEVEFTSVTPPAAPGGSWSEPVLSQQSLTIEADEVLPVTVSATVTLDLTEITAATPVIDGAARVGEILQALTPDWSPGVSFGYQWLRDGKTIAGATADDYTVVAADHGKRLSVRVTGTLNELPPVSRVSAQTAKIGTGELAAGIGEVEGTLRAGESLTADPGIWSGSPSFKYQWYLNGKAVKKATKRTWVVPGSAVGKRVSVKITASQSRYASKSVLVLTDTVVGLGEFTAQGTPTVSGTAQTGKTLTVRPGSWAPAATYRYQWLKDGAPIIGATKSSYKIPAAGIGAQYSVEVTAVRTGFASGWAVSAETVPALGTLKSATPKVSGSAKVGRTVTAVPGAWSAGAALSYQWFRASKASGGAVVPIDGATSASYALTSEDKGRFVLVRVTGALSGYATVTTSSKRIGKIG